MTLNCRIFPWILGSSFAVLMGCNGGFKSSGIFPTKEASLRIDISHDAGPEAPINEDIHFEVSGNPAGAVIAWSHTESGAEGACEDYGQISDMHFTIKCPQIGHLRVEVLVALGDNVGSASAEIEIKASVPAPNPTGDIVEFHIANNTGSKDWNTKATAIVVFVGQTLRLVNDDSIKHRMHTNGNPFPHGDDINAGASQDHVIMTSYNSDPAPAGSGPLYDHIFQGNTPRPSIWIYAYNGGTLYANNCASCHGALANSQKKNKTATQIKNAIATIPQMSGLQGVLTDNQINAIAFSLKN